MRVLFIIPEYIPHSGGGISTYYQQYIKCLAPFCEEIKVIVGSGYSYGGTDFEHKNVIVEYLKKSLFENTLIKFEKYNLFPEYKKNVAAAWAMWEQCNGGNDYDIVECVDFGLGYIPWIVHHNKPVITRLHGSPGQIEIHEPSLKGKLIGDINRQTELNLLPKCNALITHSKSNQMFWKKTLDSEIELIYPVYENNSIHTDKIEKADFGIVCGRIQQWKGPDILCKALNLLTGPKPLIKWYGRDTSFDQKISKSEDLGQKYPGTWGTYIVPQPPVPNADIYIIQKSAKFAVIPSTWDMFNFTCLEYMSNKTLVICSDGAGVSDLIESGENGFKYASQNFEALSNLIQSVNYLSDSEYCAIVDSALNTLKIKLSSSAIIPQNLTVYNKIKQNFKASERNLFFTEIYAPSDIMDNIPNLLDLQPLKKLGKYVISRMLKKIKVN